MSGKATIPDLEEVQAKKKKKKITGDKKIINLTVLER